MEVMELIFIPFIVMIIGFFLLISGYQGISKTPFDSPEYKTSKKHLKIGIILFTSIVVLLVIGFSGCLIALN